MDPTPTPEANFEKLIARWHAIGGNPIRPDARAGDPVRSDPGFEKLAAEMKKLDGMTPEPIDWKAVVALGKGLLEEKSKDLLVATYLAFALFRENAFPGLLAGLSCVEGMVALQWETLFPELKRLRGRIGAIEWLLTKLAPDLDRPKLTHEDLAVLNACLRALDGLEAALKDKLGGDAPSVGNIREKIKARAESVSSKPAEAEAPKPATATPTSRPAEESRAPVGAETLSRVEDARRMLADAGNTIRRVALYVRSQTPATPWPYRMSRILAWMELESEPANTDGKTRIPAPSPRILPQLKRLADEGNWLELVSTAEALVTESPLWLDPHRHTAQALGRLGAPYVRAKEAVEIECAALLQRWPGLADLTFANGVPFADDDTRRWIRSELLATKAGKGATYSGGATDGVETAGTTNRVNEASTKAAALLQSGDWTGAVGAFHEEMAAERSSRKRFLLRLALARLCMETDHVRLAVSQLEVLDEETTRYSLEEWEPDLCIQAVELLWRALTRLVQDARRQDPKKVDPSSLERIDAAFRRLSRLDIRAAMALDTNFRSE